MLWYNCDSVSGVQGHIRKGLGVCVCSVCVFLSVFLCLFSVIVNVLASFD